MNFHVSFGITVNGGFSVIPNENKIRIAPDSPGGGKIFFRNIAEQQVKWSGGIRKCLEIEAEDLNVDPRVDRKSLGV